MGWGGVGWGGVGFGGVGWGWAEEGGVGPPHVKTASPRSPTRGVRSGGSRGRSCPGNWFSGSEARGTHTSM